MGWGEGVFLSSKQDLSWWKLTGIYLPFSLFPPLKQPCAGENILRIPKSVGIPIFLL